MRYSSYAGCAGAWFNYQFGNIATEQQNGVFYAFSVTKIASITDGTSNTIMFGEHTRAIESSTDSTCWHWWTSGNYGDTICTAFWPDQPPEEAALWLHRQYRDLEPRHCDVEPASGRGECRLLRRIGPVPQGDDQLLAKFADDPRSSSWDGYHSNHQ